MCGWMPFPSCTKTCKVWHFSVDNISINYSYDANSYWMVKTSQKSTNAYQWIPFQIFFSLNSSIKAVLWFSLFINSKCQYFCNELQLKTKSKSYLIDALYHGIQIRRTPILIHSVRKNPYIFHENQTHRLWGKNCIVQSILHRETVWYKR